MFARAMFSREATDDTTATPIDWKRAAPPEAIAMVGA